MRNLLKPVNHAILSLVSLLLSVSVPSNNGVSLARVQAQYILGLGKQLLSTSVGLQALRTHPDTSWILGIGDITGYGYAPQRLVFPWLTMFRAFIQTSRGDKHDGENFFRS